MKFRLDIPIDGVREAFSFRTLFCASKTLRQDPLEAILVIFGRRALLLFLFESSWKKYEK